MIDSVVTLTAFIHGGVTALPGVPSLRKQSLAVVSLCPPSLYVQKLQVSSRRHRALHARAEPAFTPALPSASSRSSPTKSVLM